MLNPYSSNFVVLYSMFRGLYVVLIALILAFFFRKNHHVATFGAGNKSFGCVVCLIRAAAHDCSIFRAVADFSIFSS